MLEILSSWVSTFAIRFLALESDSIMLNNDKTTRKQFPLFTTKPNKKQKHAHYVYENTTFVNLVT